MIKPLPPTDACAYAAQWGSYMRSGDPGACLYGFTEKFTVQHEAHRQACLTEMTARRGLVLTNPARYDPDELATMDRWIVALLNARVDDL